MKKEICARVAAILTAVLVLCFLLIGVSRVETGYGQAGRIQLEEALRRAAVVCFATEGRYPPSLAYLTEHYGVQIDHSRYVVSYTVFAENLMPDITVLEK